MASLKREVSNNLTRLCLCHTNGNKSSSSSSNNVEAAGGSESDEDPKSKLFDVLLWKLPMESREALFTQLLRARSLAAVRLACSGGRAFVDANVVEGRLRVWSEQDVSGLPAGNDAAVGEVGGGWLSLLERWPRCRRLAISSKGGHGGGGGGGDPRGSQLLNLLLSHPSAATRGVECLSLIIEEKAEQDHGQEGELEGEQEGGQEGEPAQATEREVEVVHLSAREASRLAAAFPNLTRLQLSGRWAPVPGDEQSFYAALARLPRLQELQLPFYAGLEHVGLLAPACPQLRSLDLGSRWSDPRFTHLGVAPGLAPDLVPPAAMRALQSLPGLHSLSLHGMAHDSDSAADVMGWILSGSPPCYLHCLTMYQPLGRVYEPPDYITFMVADDGAFSHGSSGSSSGGGVGGAGGGHIGGGSSCHDEDEQGGGTAGGDGSGSSSVRSSGGVRGCGSGSCGDGVAGGGERGSSRSPTWDVCIGFTLEEWAATVQQQAPAGLRIRNLHIPELLVIPDGILPVLQRDSATRALVRRCQAVNWAIASSMPFPPEEGGVAAAVEALGEAVNLLGPPEDLTVSGYEDSEELLAAFRGVAPRLAPRLHRLGLGNAPAVTPGSVLALRKLLPRLQAIWVAECPNLRTKEHAVRLVEMLVGEGSAAASAAAEEPSAAYAAPLAAGGGGDELGVEIDLLVKSEGGDYITASIPPVRGRVG